MLVRLICAGNGVASISRLLRIEATLEENRQKPALSLSRPVGIPFTDRAAAGSAPLAPSVRRPSVVRGELNSRWIGEPLDRTEADTGGRLHRGLRPSTRRQCSGSSTSTSGGGDIRGYYLAVTSRRRLGTVGFDHL